jgi:hypothetical protein
MFYTQLNVIDNQLLGGWRQFKTDRSVGKLAGTAVASWFVPAIMSEFLRGRTKKEDEGWAPWAAKRVAEFPFALMPLTREALNFYQRGEYEISPVEEAVATILKSAKTVATKNPVADRMTGEDTEWTQKDCADAMQSIGYLKGIPTRQATMSAMRLHNWMSGEEEHDNPIGGLVSVATGARHD